LKGIKLVHLERLCLALRCTPHDLLEWNPSDNYVDVSHPLFALRKRDDLEDVFPLIHNMPVDELEDVLDFIRSKSKKQ